MMSTLNADVQQKMQEELQEYLSKKSLFKDYSQVMQELTAWLEKKTKS